ncbi:MAG: NAD(P)-binding domain-containing protein [Acidimicrobiales bacterium]
MSIDTTVTIIGAGQAGLAMSRCLTDQAVDHVVLERGRVAERWRSERWDSLKLLTPNWMSRLPGWQYQGPDPEGFMSMPEITRYLTDYANSFSAPVQDETTVFRARQTETGFELETNQGLVTSRFLVVATGAAAAPAIPAIASALPADVFQIAPKFYKNPDQLPDGRVLVVGASASGVQLAEEIHASGRPVTLAVSGHTRMPRTYRGYDIQLWLDLMGVLDRSYDTFGDLEAARRAPSLQLVGGRNGADIDLASLRAQGVELAGRLTGVDGNRISFADDLRGTILAADDANRRLLDRMDRWAVETGLHAEIDPISRPTPVYAGKPVRQTRVGSSGIGTVLWATGYRPDHSWVDMDVLDARGDIEHDGGIVTRAPGMYLLGLPMLRTRKSTFIDGVGADAQALCDDLVGRLHRTGSPAVA